MIDESLIEEFRKRVNHNHFVRHIYKNVNGKNLWNIICSSMDWITIAVHYICSKECLCFSKDNYVNSVKVYSYISCIDILLEATKQLHRVFVGNKKFNRSSDIFKNKPANVSDDEYFKTIRACFGAHPVNLKDKFTDMSKEEQRYASWSGNFLGEGDFSVFLYPNNTECQTISLNISFEELMQYAEDKYEYLNILIKQIIQNEEEYNNKKRNTKIAKGGSIIEQIEILINENEDRLENDYYDTLLKRLKLIFETEIHNVDNLKIVNAYRELLKDVVVEIYQNLQNMVVEDIESNEKYDCDVPDYFKYVYAKFYEGVFGESPVYSIALQELKDYVSIIVNLDLCDSRIETYVVFEAAKYFKKNKMNNK